MVLAARMLSVIGISFAQPSVPALPPGCLPKDDQTDLWCPAAHGVAPSADLDVHVACYKIPSLLRIPNSTRMLGFIEARRFSCSDGGWIDLLLRHSTDDGKVRANAAKQYCCRPIFEPAVLCCFAALLSAKIQTLHFCARPGAPRRSSSATPTCAPIIPSGTASETRCPSSMPPAAASTWCAYII